MKKKLIVKVLLLYLIFSCLTGLLIVCIKNTYIKKSIITSSAKTLYDQANSVSKFVEEYDFNYISDYKDHDFELQNISSYLGSDIIILSKGCFVCYDSRGLFKVGDNITEFKESYFGTNHYTIGDFYQVMPKNTISVMAPIIKGMNTIGYVTVHLPESSLKTNLSLVMKEVWQLYGVMEFLAFLCILIFHFYTHPKLDKISKASKEFAKGNLRFGKINVNSKDEIGEIGQNLDIMASKLIDNEEYQNKFIANISHDFRSPLTSIKGYLQAMQDGTIPPELMPKYLDIVLNETNRLTKLTNNLLTINAWDNNGRELNLTTFNINDVIRQTLETFKGSCDKKNIHFNLTVKNQNYPVTADRDRISQVIYNLVDNAIKFSHNDSTVYLSITDNYEKVSITIRDTGIGIPKDSQLKIWDRFYKNDLSRGKDKTGSGLGLAIVKDIINAHQENIICQSKEGEGTSFTFTLPLAK